MKLLLCRHPILLYYDLYILRTNYTLAAEKALCYARLDYILHPYTMLTLDQEPECILMGMGQLYIMWYDSQSKTLVACLCNIHYEYL